MTLLCHEPLIGGEVRVLVLGAGAYPHAGRPTAKVPALQPITSAAQSARKFCDVVLGPWRYLFEQPLGSIHLLLSDPDQPDGATYVDSSGVAHNIEPCTKENVVAARKAWMADCGPEDILVFYCCGHGIWLPDESRTFLCSDFGVDPDDPWPYAIALDDFAFGLKEQPPRRQWLFYDCCANTPPQAANAINGKATALLSATVGGQGKAAARYPQRALSQVRIGSAVDGALAFGRTGGTSRFFDAVKEAGEGAAFISQSAHGLWRADMDGLVKAISTYAKRVAATADRAYYTFPLVTVLEGQAAPTLLVRNQGPDCLLRISATPDARLLQADLMVTDQQGVTVASQAAGHGGQTPFVRPVQPFGDYDITATFPSAPVTRRMLALPPLLDVEV